MSEIAVLSRRIKGAMRHLGTGNAKGEVGEFLTDR